MATGEAFSDTQLIWREFGDDLRLFILRRVNSPEDADDLLQETFIKIHRKLDTLEDRERLNAWVYQIARNTITDYYRRQRPVELITRKVGSRLLRSNQRGQIMTWNR